MLYVRFVLYTWMIVYTFVKAHMCIRCKYMHICERTKNMKMLTSSNIRIPVVSAWQSDKHVHWNWWATGTGLKGFQEGVDYRNPSCLTGPMLSVENVARASWCSLFIVPPIQLSICLYISLSFCRSTYLPLLLVIYLYLQSVCPYLSASVYLSVLLSICLFISFSTPVYSLTHLSIYFSCLPIRMSIYTDLPTILHHVHRFRWSIDCCYLKHVVHLNSWILSIHRLTPWALRLCVCASLQVYLTIFDISSQSFCAVWIKQDKASVKLSKTNNLDFHLFAPTTSLGDMDHRWDLGRPQSLVLSGEKAATTNAKWVQIAVYDMLLGSTRRTF